MEITEEVTDDTGGTEDRRAIRTVCRRAWGWVASQSPATSWTPRGRVTVAV